MKKFAFLVTTALVSMGVLAVAPTPAGADLSTTGSIDFETGYTDGSVYGQNGWTGSDGCGTVDQAVVDNSGFPAAPPSFGTKSFRMSNSVFGGCFSQPKSPSTTNEAGETDATNGGQSGGTRGSLYEAEWTVASSTGLAQDGLAVVVSPDRGDGARMSYLRMLHTGGQLNLLFYDVQGVDPPQATPCSGCANFVDTDLGNFDPTVPHTIKMTMQFVEGGPNNDIVQVFVDNVLVHTGGSWEDYFTLDTESAAVEGQHSRTVDSLLFRPSTAAPAVAGQGFLFDNISVSTLGTCTTTCFVSPGGSGNMLGNDAANALPTIQAGVNAVTAGGTVNVAAGTYDEHVTIGKNFDLVGAGAATTIIDPSTDGAAIDITAGGTSAADADRLKIRNLRTTGATPASGAAAGSGVAFTGAGPIGHVTIDGVDSVDNASNGVYVGVAGGTSDFIVNNANLSNNGPDTGALPRGDGFLIPSGHGNFDGLTITNSHLDDNVFAGLESYLPTSTTAASNRHLTNVLIEDTSFSGNGYKGIYVERLSEAILRRLEVIGSGTVVDGTFTFPSGVDINLKYQDYTNISVLDSTISDNGNTSSPTPTLNSSGLTIKARGSGGPGNDIGSYTTNPASLTGVTVSGNTISDNVAAGVRFGEPGQTNLGPTDVHVNQNSITGNNTGTDSFGLENVTTTQTDGECNWWGAANGPGGNGPGSGDFVSTNVDFDPFKIATDSTCPPVVPGAPTGAAATPGDESASVAFAAPASNGGATIDSYTATCASGDPDAHPTRTETGAGSPLVVENLDNGTLYVCWVFATNSAGDGPNSNFTFVTPATTPGAPTGVSATRGDGTLAVSFTPPASDGGSPITGYTATCNPGAHAGSGAGSPVTVSGVTNGTGYTCTVHATNLAGEGSESDAVVVAALIPDEFQPDLLARPHGVFVAYSGNNNYSVVRVNRRVTTKNPATSYNLKLENDGNVTDTINLKAVESGSSNFIVAYRQGPFTLPNMTTTGRNYTLNPGQNVILKVTIRAKAAARSSQTFLTKLTAKSSGDSTKDDTARLRATKS